MAELGGMLAAAILKVVSDQIGSAIGGQISLQMNFDKELRKMKMALESVEALLKVAERRSITDEPTLLWLKRLKDAMYAISDMIDEFEGDFEGITQPSPRKFSFKKYLAIMIPCLIVGPKITMANKMETMREDLEVITDQHKKFRLREDTNASEPKVTDIRETTSIMETQIVGRTMEKEQILASLSENMHKDITVLPVCGIGGLGKTTLAKMVYNSSQFKEYSQVWVYVSQIFDLKNIGNSIISQLSEEVKESEYTSMQMIHNSLQKLLANKKILIVLDDLWEGEVFHLKSLMDMLNIGKGSNVVVIVTTRDEDIANKISTIRPYKLAPLTDDMCWSIIKQKSAFESRSDKEQLEEIGKVIAMKCRGVALAANSLGHILQQYMEPREWESVRDSNIWNVSSSIDPTSSQVLASLKLSYSIMPSYLKLCFAYCAIFPKGHKILKDDLIHQWVSLGFSTQQLGERCIRQLLGLSFLEQSKSKSISEVDFENDSFFTMHDLVHDLARSVMVDDILVSSEHGITGGSCFHFALLNDCGKPLESSKIRALRFMDCDKIELHDAAFSSAKSLRVLDLSECIIHKLPDSIGVLKQLRYLNAPRVQDAVIPNDITKLTKLIYLNLHGSSRILALPESIGEIEGLEYLDLSGCSELEKLPESFGRLKELVHLDLSNCSCIGGISEFLGSLTKLKYLNLSHCQKIGEIPETLGVLSKLEYLNISFSSYLDCCQEAEVLGALNKLEYLNLSSECCGLLKLPEALGTFIQLKYLNLSGCKSMSELPRSFGSLKNLVHLDLSDCVEIDCIDEALVGLSNLQHLNLHGTCIMLLPEDVTKLRYLNMSDLINMTEDTMDSLINYICSNLSNLEHLDLSDNFRIDSIPESICNLRKLHTLNLSKCNYIEKIPGSIATMDSLKFLHVNDCWGITKAPQLGSSAISLPHFGVQPGDGHSSSNLVQLQHVDPLVLKITELENVKSVEEAQCINLMGKKKLEDLKLEWTRDAEGFVDHKILMENLVPPSTLKTLEICGYSGVSFLAWLVLDQLPNLQRLVLRNMAKLEEWNTSCSKGEDHVIKQLEIHDCPLLRMTPLPPKAREWVISNSDNVLSSWEEGTGLPSTLKRLEICGYDGVSFPAWLVLDQLPNLEHLVLRGMANVEEWNTSCSKGEDHVIWRLEIHDCPLLRMTPLPPKARECMISNSDNVLISWEECTEPPSTLKWLEIRRYDGVSFPAWLVLDQLPNLEILVFRGMANVEEWNTSCSKGEDHWIDELEIHDCPLLRMEPHPPKAKKWVISNSDNVLSSWEECTGPHTDATSSSSLVTTELSVKNCKVPLHQWRLLQHFPCLTSLCIKGSVDLTGSPEVIRHLSSLETLTLEDQELEELPKWLNENNGQLTNLVLMYCNSMTSLPHSLGELTSLKKLVLWSCAVLSSLPESLQQLTNLSRLLIWKCCGIKSLPDGMEQLTNLQNLDIYGCPDLKQWCELEENKMKLAHIKKKKIW